ncbi:MAG: hypothetical protein O7A69_02505, partial [SAR324 cluster bacterium]|nr:hypothetical protein [SAR324 cluster bacterium]
MKKPAKTSASEDMRTLPSITEVDRYLEAQGLPHGKPVREQVQQVLAGFRERLRGAGNGRQAAPGRQAVLEAVATGVSRPPVNQLRPVINATGV